MIGTTMAASHLEISVKGKSVKVPSAIIDSRHIVLTGGTVRLARIHDEEWMENSTLTNVDAFLEALKRSTLRPDIFTFAQPLELAQAVPLSFHAELSDAAVVPLTSFERWWESLPQESRKNTRKAEKKGIVARVAAFDDELVRGIKSLYDETPVRQGRRFWHYGKDLESIRRENGTYLERSDFIAAYLERELVGFIKIVYVGKVARIMQILAKNAHQDKKTTNLLLSKAVETCCHRGMGHFVYGQYYYGNKGHTPITEFKRRNGFERVVLRRYFAPLTLKGRAALALRLHLGVRHLIPSRVASLLLDFRSRMYRRNTRSSVPPAPAPVAVATAEAASTDGRP